MGRLALSQLLRIPKYISEMVVIRSQEQLASTDRRAVSRFGSPFELNLQNWSRPVLSPSVRELVEGPVGVTDTDDAVSRFGRVGSPDRIDLRRARRRAKYFIHISTTTGGLFTNWKQISRTVAVYRDFLHNRMEYELTTKTTAPIDYTPSSVVQKRALARFAKETESETIGLREEKTRLAKVNRRLHCMLDETKVIGKQRFRQMDHILSEFPLL